MKVCFKKKTLGSKPKNFDNSPTARGEKMASQCIMSCFPKVKKIKTKEKPKVFVYLKDMPIAMQIDFIIEGSYTYLPLDRATQTRCYMEKVHTSCNIWICTINSKNRYDC